VPRHAYMLQRCPKGGAALLLREHISVGDDQIGDPAIVDRAGERAGVGKDHAGLHFAAFVAIKAL